MNYGEREILRGLRGGDVEEVQVRLAGFRGTVPDGDFGPGTELQVLEFQRRYMGMEVPTGVVDGDTYRAIDDFAGAYPLDFRALKCPCGECDGFGQGKFKGRYRSGSPKVERFYRYEYPGIHRMILWAVRGAFFHLSEYDFTITSGYRCSVRNEQKGRTSTNHHGKAVDFDVPRLRGEDGADDRARCDGIRGKLVELCHAQVGWSGANRKALEPAEIAPTWVHYDVRCYGRKYLAERFFCRSAKELNNKLPIRV